MRKVTIGGKTFKSIAEAARNLGKTYDELYKELGNSYMAAPKTPRDTKPVRVDNGLLKKMKEIEALKAEISKKEEEIKAKLSYIRKAEENAKVLSRPLSETQSVFYQGSTVHVTAPLIAAGEFAIDEAPAAKLYGMLAAEKTKSKLRKETNTKRLNVVKDHKGKKFASVAQMCACYNIYTSTFNYRRNKGLSLKDALTRPNRQLQVVYNGVTYKNMLALAQAYDVDVYKIQEKMDHGKTLRDILG